MPHAIDVARRYAEAVATLRAVHDFDTWIGQFWQDYCPAMAGPSQSHAGRGEDEPIVWLERDEMVLGYLPGYDGCFCIPLGVVLPEFPFSASTAAVLNGNDVVISAAMREEIQPPGS